MNFVLAYIICSNLAGLGYRRFMSMKTPVQRYCTGRSCGTCTLYDTIDPNWCLLNVIGRLNKFRW